MFSVPAHSRIDVELPRKHPFFPAGALICCAASEAVKQAYAVDIPPLEKLLPRLTVKVQVSVSAEQVSAVATVPSRPRHPAALTADSALPGRFTPARDPARSEGAARDAFARLGDTRFQLGDWHYHNPDALFIPPSQLNELRRQLCERLEHALAAEPRPELPALPEEPPPSAPRRWLLRVDRLESLAAFTDADWQGVDELLIELSAFSPEVVSAQWQELTARCGRNRLRIALPPLQRAWERRPLQDLLKALLDAGCRRWQAAGIWAWPALGVTPDAAAVAAAGLDLSGDWFLYSLNPHAVAQWRAMGIREHTLSVEDGRDNLTVLLKQLGSRAVVVVYQDPPLFLSEACTWSALSGACAGPRACKFTDMRLVTEHGDRLLVVNRNCRSTVLGEDAFSLGGHVGELQQLGATNFRADFCWRTYQPTQVRERWQRLRADDVLADTHTGNFFRGLE